MDKSPITNLINLIEAQSKGRRIRMDKLSVDSVIEQVEALDAAFKDSGWVRDSCIDLKYKGRSLRACLTIYAPEEDEEDEE